MVILRVDHEMSSAARKFRVRGNEMTGATLVVLVDGREVSTAALETLWVRTLLRAAVVDGELLEPGGIFRHVDVNCAADFLLLFVGVLEFTSLRRGDGERRIRDRDRSTILADSVLVLRACQQEPGLTKIWNDSKRNKMRGW